MLDARYKAFISYSHQDDKWAAWLHRALESYRPPSKIVGQRGATTTDRSFYRPFIDNWELESE